MRRRQRTQKVPVALPKMESAPEHWLRNIRMSGFTFTVLGLIIMAVIVLAPGLRLVIEQQQQLAALKAAVDSQEAGVDQLEGDVARWSDPAYIEAQARGRLDYVFPGDVSYFVIDDSETAVTDDGAPISDTIQTTEVDWMSTVVGSIFTAGLTDDTTATLESPVVK